MSNEEKAEATRSAKATTSVTDGMVCFGLYAAARAATRAYRTFLAPWNLTYPQYLVMVVLWNDGDQTVSSLGRAMHLDSGTLSPLLRRLEDAGYVTRVRDREDERVVHIASTADGHALRTELAHVPDAFRELVESRDADDLAELIGSLKLLTRSLEQATEDAAATSGRASTV